MPKPSHHDRLVRAGLEVVLCQGYAGTSVRDVVRAAGVPQGSFTNHFRSKEAFVKEVLELYFSIVRENMEKTLRNDSLPPLRRLKSWLDLQIAFVKQAHFRTGCLIGNLGIEAGEQSNSIRKRLVEIFGVINESLVYCLRAAVAAGELPASTDVRELAEFLYASWHGALLKSKLELSSKPLERFKDIVSKQILR